MWHAGSSRVGGGSNGLGDHLHRLLDAALHAGAHHGLARKPLLLADIDVDSEDHRIRVVDHALRQRLVSARTLGLDDEFDVLICASGSCQRVGSHEGVRDAGGAGGDGDDARTTRAVTGRSGCRSSRRRSSGAGCCRVLRGLVTDGGIHDRDDVFRCGRGPQGAGEVILHEATGELRQHRQVRLCRGVGGGDEEHEVGGAVWRPEVDAGRKPGEREARRGHRGALGVRNGDAAGKAGLVLLLARPGVIEEPLRAVGAPLRGDLLGEGADDRGFV